MDKSPETSHILSTIVTAVVTFLTGGGLMKLIAAWQKKRREDKLDMQADANMFREMLLERIVKLEEEQAANAQKILELTEENAMLKAENLAMREQIEELKNRKS